MNLMTRRRALMGMQVGSEPSSVVPTGYITDGLVFFLDGLQLASDEKWTDIINGKECTLTNCTKVSNGIAFDGTAYGVIDGAIIDPPSNYNQQTIEVVLDNATISSSRKTVIHVPQITVDGTKYTGLGMRFAGDTSAAIRIVGTSIAPTNVRVCQVNKNTVIRRVSFAQLSTSSIRCVVNGTNYSNNYTSSNYAVNNTNTTLIGAGWFSNAIGNNFVGTICAIRLYSKQLTVAEMQANQAVDLARYLGG